MSERVGQITPVRARQVMHAHTPRGWKIKMLPSHTRGASGLCDFNNRTIGIPFVCDDYTLFVALHEFAHAKLHGRGCKKSQHVQEYEAERWAAAAMRKSGFHVTRTMLRAGKEYVAEEIFRDMLKEIPIDPVVRRWVRGARNVHRRP